MSIQLAIPGLFDDVLASQPEQPAERRPLAVAPPPDDSTGLFADVAAAGVTPGVTRPTFWGNLAPSMGAAAAVPQPLDVAMGAARGFGRAFGSEAPGMGPDTEQAWRNTGLFGPAAGQGNPGQVLIESVVKGAAVPADIVLRAIPAAFGAFQGGAEALAAPITGPRLARDLAAIPESTMMHHGDAVRPRPEPVPEPVPVSVPVPGRTRPGGELFTDLAGVPDPATPPVEPPPPPVVSPVVSPPAEPPPGTPGFPGTLPPVVVPPEPPTQPPAPRVEPPPAVVPAPAEPRPATEPPPAAPGEVSPSPPEQAPLPPHGTPPTETAPATPPGSPSVEPPPAAAAEPRTPVSEPPPSQPPPATPGQPPSPPPVTGESTVTTATGRKVGVRYEVVPLDTLTAASGDLQPRERADRAASELQINNIAANLDPARLMRAPEADRGAPIVGPDGVVESGNGRVAAIQRAAARHPERYAAYVEALRREGYDVPDDGRVHGLVARRVSEMAPEDRIKFVAEANQAATQRFSAGEQARVDAANLSGHLLGTLDHTVDALHGNNHAFVRQWVATLPESERNAVLTADGSLSAEGLRRLHGALLARAYDDKGTLARALEHTDDAVRSASGALVDAAPAWAKLRSRIAAGEVPPEFDTSRQLTEAVEKVRVAREKRQGLNDILNQQDAFNPIEPETERYIRALFNVGGGRSASRPAVADVLRRYAEEAMRQQSNQGGLFGDVVGKVRPVDALDAILKRRDEAAAPPAAGQTSMFGQGTGLRPGETAPVSPEGQPTPVSGETGATGAAAPGVSPEVKPAPVSGETGATAPRDLAAEAERIAARWEELGKPDMAKAIRAGVKLGADEARVKFWNDRLAAEEARQGGTAPPAADTFTLDGFMATDKTDARKWADFGANASPEGKALAAEVEAHAQELTRRMNAAGFRANDINATSPAEVQALHRARSELMGKFARFVRQEVANAKGYKGTDPRQREATRAELRRVLDAEPVTPPVKLDPKTGETGEPMAEAADSRPLPDNAAAVPAGGTRPPLDGVTPARDFNAGTSPYREVFSDAGHDPDTAVNLPIQRQVEIIRDQVKVQFGFRAVELDERQHPKELRDQMANFYTNAKEMAAALGMPYEAIGLSGRVTFSTKPYFQKNQALGWYRPGTREINIPGRSNSFAHEWTHALDHYLSEALGKNPKAMKLLSQKHSMWDDPATLNGRRVTPGTPAEAFVGLLRTMYGADAATAAEALKLQMDLRSGNKAKMQAALARMPALETEFAKNSRNVPQQGLSYWSSPVEMLARAHEAYVADRIKAQGGDTRAIAKSDYEPQGPNDGFARVYPQEAERAAIFQRFTDLHDALRAETILGPGAGARPSGLGMVDPARFDRMLPAGTPGGVRGALQAEARAQQNWLAKLFRNAGYDPAAADPGHLPAKTRAIDVAASLGYSHRGMMERIIARQPTPQARGAYQSIMDQLSPAEHTRQGATGRTIGQVFEEAVRSNSRSNTNRLANILASNDLDWDRATRDPGRLADIEREKDLLHHALTLPEGIDEPMPGRNPGDPAVPVPANIKKAAGELRFLLDQEWERNQKAGIEIGYTKNGYFPRLYDDTAIFGDAAGFKRDAATLHGRMFEDAVGSDPDKLLQAYNRLDKDTRDGMSPVVQNGMIDLRDALRERQKLQDGLANSTDPARDQARIDQLDQTIEDLHNQMHDDVRDTHAAGAADDWYSRINNGDATDYDTRGPSSQYTSKRELPPYADAIMRPWMETDPGTALPRYFQQSARRVAWAERFGPKGKKLDDWIDQATKGGARGEDNRAMRKLVESVTGRAKTGSAGKMEAAADVVHAYGTLALMPRAVWSSLSEPVAVAIKTGRMRDIYSVLTKQMQGAFKTADAAQRTELANALGVTTSHLLDNILVDRANAHYRDSPNLGRVLSNFFRRSGLTALTNNQRRAMLGTGHEALAAWSRDFLGTNARKGKDAAAEFTDLGVHPTQHRAFAEWVTAHDGLPSLQDLETPGGRLWGRTVTRFVDHVIQDPLRVDKPVLSQNPVGRLAYGLTAFNYSFFHNLVERPLGRSKARIGESYADARAAGAGRLGAVGAAGVTAAREGGKLGMAAGAIYAAALATTAVRESIFNGDAWNQHEKDGDLHEWLMDLAIQRTGINGPFDPIAQAMTGLKYERDLSGLVAGPHLGFALQAAESIVKGFANHNESDTNTADFNAIRGVYNLLAVPAISYGLSSIPGGPIGGRAAGAAMQYLTSRQSSNRVAEALVGPKGTREGGEPPPEPTDEALAKKEEQRQGSGLLNVPPSLLDDIAAPAARVAAPLWAAAPKPLKLGVAGLGALLAGRNLSNEFSRFKP